MFVFGRSRIAGVTFHGPPTTSLPPGGFIAKHAPDGSLLDAQRVVVNGKLGQAEWASTDEWILTGSAKPNATLYGENLTVHSTQQDGFVARTDTTGLVEWVTMFPSSGSAHVHRAALLPDDRVAVSGYFVDDLLLPQDTLQGAPGEWTYFVAVLDADGIVEWAFPLVSEEFAHAADLKADHNGDILLYGRYDAAMTLGTYTLAPYASTNGYVARLSADGECKAAWGFGRTYFASGSILPTEHGLYLASEFDSTLVMGSYTVQGTHPGPERYHDLFIARFDSLSGFTTSVPAFKQATNDQLLIYANPNQGLCTVELPADVIPGRELLLIIRDSQGRLVQQENLRWHSGNLQLDIRAQARGIYHAELWDGDRRYTGKIIFQSVVSGENPEHGKKGSDAEASDPCVGSRCLTP